MCGHLCSIMTISHETKLHEIVKQLVRSVVRIIGRYNRTNKSPKSMNEKKMREIYLAKRVQFEAIITLGLPFIEEGKPIVAISISNYFLCVKL